jgi:dolichol-phosphate mannosyltransferase
VYNEAPALPELHAAIEGLYAQFPETEVIFVDDGSKDGSKDVLREIAGRDPRVKVVSFHRNYGQTAAMLAGIDHATGDVIVPIDSDLENDPGDIPRLLAEMEKGSDVVSGWRQDRWKGSFLARKLPSLAANKLISVITGVHLHDYGCTLKAYKREVLAGVPLYGEMHRFIPAYAAWQGATVTELPVRYTPRKFGKSNYGISRTIRVLLDLLVIQFLHRYMNRPIHFFGGLVDLHLVQTPLPLLAALLIIMGVNLVMMGVLSEMQMRTYYEAQKTKSYRIKEKMNF